MSKLSKLEPVVKKVLENFEETRSDDFKLIYSVYRELDFVHTTRELFYEIMMNHDLYKLPPFESITRCRRKIQKDYPELANEKTKEKRLNATSDYIDYAIDGYNPSFIKMVDSIDKDPHVIEGQMSVYDYL